MEFLESLPFTLGDIAIVLLILLSGFLAYFRGLVTEILAVAGWVGAAVVTAIFLKDAQALATRYLSKHVPFQLVLDFGAGAAVFVVSLVVFAVILRGVARLVRGREASPIDRLLGFVYGLARGLVLLAVLWLVATAVFPASTFPAAVRDARTLPMVRATGEFLLQFAPSRFRSPDNGVQETRATSPHGPSGHDTRVATLYNSAATSFVATRADGKGT